MTMVIEVYHPVMTKEKINGLHRRIPGEYSLYSKSEIVGGWKTATQYRKSWQTKSCDYMGAIGRYCFKYDIGHGFYQLVYPVGKVGSAKRITL